MDALSTQSGQVPANPGQEPNVTPQATPEAQVAPQPKTFDETYVKQLRDEAAASRTGKTAAEARVRELEAAQLSEQEKKDLRLKELEVASDKFQADLKDANTRTTAYKSRCRTGDDPGRGGRGAAARGALGDRVRGGWQAHQPQGSVRGQS
jgi:hypothetical protein